MEETVKTRWGSYTVVYSTPEIKVKLLNIDKNCNISVQYHKHRSEEWTVLKGTPKVFTGYVYLSKLYGGTRDLKVGSKISIPQGEVHSIQAQDECVTILEVQRGDILEEEDIIRLSYDFNI